MRAYGEGIPTHCSLTVVVLCGLGAGHAVDFLAPLFTFSNDPISVKTGFVGSRLATAAPVTRG